MVSTSQRATADIEPPAAIYGSPKSRLPQSLPVKHVVSKKDDPSSQPTKIMRVNSSLLSLVHVDNGRIDRKKKDAEMIAKFLKKKKLQHDRDQV